MWVHVPDRAGALRKWAGHMIDNADASKPRVNKTSGTSRFRTSGRTRMKGRRRKTKMRRIRNG